MVSFPYQCHNKIEILSIERRLKKPQKDSQIDDITVKIHPKPITQSYEYVAKNIFTGKHALIISGDSGSGQAVSILVSKEGAHLTFTYTRNEKKDEKEDRPSEINHRVFKTSVTAFHVSLELLNYFASKGAPLRF